MLPFLVTPCLVVAVQPCMERIPIKKKKKKKRHILKLVKFQFGQKPFLVCASRKSEKAISKPNQSKTTEVQNGNKYNKANFKISLYTS